MIINKFFLKSFALIIIFLILGFFLVQVDRVTRPANIHIVKIGGQNIVVDVATEDMQRQQGLSGRKIMAEDEGMLFVFDYLGKHSFWMKDMNFPIDIIWLAPWGSGGRENMKIVYIKKNARPELYPESYMPDRDAKYVLEVVAGFSDKNNLKEGDRVMFTY